MNAFEERLTELRGELEAGTKHLELLDARRADLRDTLLRIGGAIQVLEEVLASRNGDAAVAEVAVQAGE